ncbi:MAG: hypothetical protein AAF772_04560 [Acidobacteriota bacterium]
MSTVLTDFIRHLRDGDAPSDALVDQVIDALRGLLGAEMKRRSNWSSPPRFLGVVGHAHWVSHDDAPDGDALDELASDFFTWLLARRISLTRQLDDKPIIDGLVARNARFFLLEIHRQHDPIGYRLFDVLRGAVLRGVDNGQLRVVAGDAQIRNDTVLMPEALAQADDAVADGQLTLRDPQPLADRWLSDHLDAMITARHAARTRLNARLSDELAAWMRSQKAPVRFGDLAAALKRDARGSWSSRLRDAHSAGASAAAFDDPGGARARRRFARIARCVAISIEHSNERVKTRHYLIRLWHFLEAFAIDTLPGDVLPDASESSDDAQLPSNRQIAKLLDVPRERVPDLLARLGAQLKACQHAVDGPSTMTPTEPPPPTDPALPPRQRARAALAAAQAADRARSDANVETRVARRGDVVQLADAPDVFWLMLGDASDDARDVPCVPVDTVPLLGPDDRPLEALDADTDASDRAIWIARSALRADIAPARLRAAHRVDRVPVAQLAALDRPASDDGRLRLDPDDADYRAWIEAGPARARDALVRADDAPTASVRAFPSDAAPSALGRRGLTLLAAALLALTIGLGVAVLRLDDQINGLQNDTAVLQSERDTAQDRVAELSQPILISAFKEVTLGARDRSRLQIDVGASAEAIQFTLLFDGPELPGHPRYRVDWIDPADGRLLYRLGGVAFGDQSTLVFRIDTLPSKVALRVYGTDADGGGAVLIETREIVVRSSGSAAP